MTITSKITITNLCDEDASYYKHINPGFKPTGEVLTQEWSNGGSESLVVMTGSYTPYGMCRDCGDHYIIGRYSRFDRINKGTFEIIRDVEDY